MITNPTIVIHSILSFCCGFEVFSFVGFKAGLDATTLPYANLSILASLLIVVELSTVAISLLFSVLNTWTSFGLMGLPLGELILS